MRLRIIFLNKKINFNNLKDFKTLIKKKII